jgi:hypothetical protein
LGLALSVWDSSPLDDDALDEFKRLLGSAPEVGQPKL